MKNFQQVSRRVSVVILQALLLIVVLNACNQQTEPISSRANLAKARSGPRPKADANDCPEGYHPVFVDGSLQCVPDETAVDCSQIQNVQSTERAKAVSRYGTDGGNRFDQLRADSNPYDEISNFSPAVYAYERQIEGAIRNGAGAYANSFGGCDTCIDNYSSTAFLGEINNYLTPVKNTITNDGSLTDVQRSTLLAAIQAVYDNWDDVGRLIEEHGSCFPNPAWYGSNSSAVITSGFFSGVVKALKKVVNIVASVVVNIVSYALNGAIVGALFSCAGQSEVNGACAAAGLVPGAVIGGLVGLVVGIVRVSNGTYDACIFPPCS